MITEEARNQVLKNQREKRMEWLKQVISASSRYERLISNSDFISYLKDLKKVADIHKEQIDIYVKILVAEDSIFKRMRTESVIMKHQIRREQIEELVNYPQKLIQEANEAREELSTLKAQEESTNGTND